MYSIHSIDKIGLDDEPQEVAITSSDKAGLEEEVEALKCSPVNTSDELQDGGYGWVIVASTFLAFSLISFHFLTFGIFASEFVKTFSLSEAEVGLIASLRMGLFSFVGIFAGPLVQKFGCRPVAMTAVVASTFAYVTTAFARDRFTLTISYGLVAGLGTGLIAIPSIVIVQQYFNKRRAIAAGISSVGMGFFAFVCSPLARYLVDTFGWRGASLLFGGFSLQMLVPTALYRPPKGRKIPLASENNSSHKNQPKTLTSKMKAFVGYFFQKRLFTRYYALYLVTNVTRIAVVEVYYLRLALIAGSIGLEPLKAALLPSVVAVMTITSRGLSGFQAHCIPPHVVYGVFNFLSALVLFVVPLLPATVVAHSVCAALFGFCAGSVMGIMHTTLVSLVGVALLPLALSSGCLFSGLFQLTNNLVVGWMLDETGSYRIPLWYAATLHSFGSLGAIAIIFLKWREKKVDKTKRDDILLESPLDIVKEESTTAAK